MPLSRSEISLSSGNQVITSVIEVADGSTAGGETGVTFITGAVFTGTINGIARLPATEYRFVAVPGKTLSAIPYTVPASSSLTIDSIT